jgi:hypothetical protein
MRAPLGSRSAGRRSSGVVLRAELVGLGEHDVEHHRARLLRRETVQQLGVHHARPGPASGLFLHRNQAVLVDVDQHDVRVGHESGRVRADHGVEQAVFQRLHPVQEGDL